VAFPDFNSLSVTGRVEVNIMVDPSAEITGAKSAQEVFNTSPILVSFAVVFSCAGRCSAVMETNEKAMEMQ
jgi:hypothetical protein